MNHLFYTHVLLWWLDDNPTLSKEARGNHHRDLFDRMLIAQAMVERLHL